MEQHHWKSSAELAEQGFKRIQAWTNKDVNTSTFDTGFTELNELLSGFQPGNVVLLGSRPSMGKTALMQNIILNVAKQGHGVGIFSLAESAEQFLLRLTSITTEISMFDIRYGRINNETELPKIKKACEHIHSLPIFLQDRPVTVSELKTSVHLLKRQQDNLALVVVDYIGLLRMNNHALTFSEATAEASRTLKILAQELNVCVFALSQLNRSLEQRSDKRPILSDLRGSGALEQDADVVWFLYRDEYYDAQSPHKGLAEIIVAKQRNGPTGMITLQFEGQHLRFSSPSFHSV